MAINEYRYCAECDVSIDHLEDQDYCEACLQELEENKYEAL